MLTLPLMENELVDSYYIPMIIFNNTKQQIKVDICDSNNVSIRPFYIHFIVLTCSLFQDS